MTNRMPEALPRGWLSLIGTCVTQDEGSMQHPLLPAFIILVGTSSSVGNSILVKYPQNAPNYSFLGYDMIHEVIVGVTFDFLVGL